MHIQVDERLVSSSAEFNTRTKEKGSINKMEPSKSLVGLARCELADLATRKVDYPAVNLVIALPEVSGVRCGP